MSQYHEPVMLEECVEALNIRPEGTYIDVTYGAGGHSKSILKELNDKGHLYGFDQDGDVGGHVIEDGRFTFIKANFRFLERYMRYYDVSEVDGILADLGVSSHQLDFPERGFSYRYDAQLDMRMNEYMTRTARDILQTYNQDELQKMLSENGEVRNARSLARSIVEKRKEKEIATTMHLNELLEQNLMGNRQKYLAQVYQALRIEVNEELEVLKEMLEGGLKVLKPGGRFVVMSYHSLEDRLVKNFFKSGNFDGKLIKDDYGNIERPFKLINKKVIVAESEEIARNSRSASAKLRIAEKV